MRLVHCLAFLLICCYSSVAQLTSSNLPIVIINTADEGVIVDDPKIDASMKIVYRGSGQTTQVSDQDNESYLDYEGNIKIEIRGSSSQALDKKQYGFTTYDDDFRDKKNVKLLDMPSENDWILNSLPFDPSYMRDYICYHLSNQIGEYAARAQYCEVIINDQYMGLYMLLEKLKADKDRIDILRMPTNATTGVELTGGYITRADRADEGDDNTWVMQSHVGWSPTLNHVHPKSDEIATAQHNYIKNLFFALEAEARNKNASIIDGYPSIIDVRSFVDHMLLNELSANVDGYQLSAYFHKDIGGKLRAGPIWDHNLTFGNDLFMWNFDRSHVDTWQFDNGDNVGPSFWKNLFDEEQFNCQLQKRWASLRGAGEPYSLSQLHAFVDQTKEYISQAVQRDIARWNHLNQFDSRVNSMKTFMTNRFEWMDNQLSISESCPITEVPPLVISKINYNPYIGEKISSNNYEFIELTNIGDETIDLTGIYFGGIGFNYQFTAGEQLASNANIILASNEEKYEVKYQSAPYDVYQRHLNNGGQHILLLDAMGNIIDEVNYNNNAPWPDADNNGYYLELTNLSGDNNNSSNWVATRDLEFTLNLTQEEVQGITIYPNPASSQIQFTSPTRIETIDVFDFQGRIVLSAKPNESNGIIDLNEVLPGLYLIRYAGSNLKGSHKIVIQ